MVCDVINGQVDESRRHHCGPVRGVSIVPQGAWLGVMLQHTEIRRGFRYPAGAWPVTRGNSMMKMVPSPAAVS